MLYSVEDALQKQHLAFVNAMISNDPNSFDIDIYGVVGDVYHDVYGHHSGEESTYLKDSVRAMCIGDEFEIADDHTSGLFKEGWLFTTSVKVMVGDLVDIKRTDGRSRRYKINDQQSIGTTQAVFKKFHLSSIGD